MTGGNSDSETGVSHDDTAPLARPSRRAVLGGIGGVAAGGLAIGGASAQFGSSGVGSGLDPSGPATPTVEGPIEGGSQTGRPLTAAPHDFESAGYVEEEYFISGEAQPIDTGGLFGDIGGGNESTDSSGDGTEPAEYKTRMLLYRPADGADFNGGVLVEWFNVSLQTDFPVAWPNAYDYLQQNGWAVLLVSAQKVGVDDSAEDRDLVSWDPERYGDLHHPGDVYALDIFAQAIQALRQGSDDGPTNGPVGDAGLWSGTPDDSSGGLWNSPGSSGSAGGSGGSGGWLGSNLELGQLGGSSGGSGGLWGGSGGSTGGSSGSSSGGLWDHSDEGDSGRSGGIWGGFGESGSSGGTGGGSDDPDPMASYDVEFVVATGQSQSSGYINSFINEVEPTYDVVDGFLPAAGMPINLSKDVDPTIWLNTMSEAAGGSLTSPGQGDGSGSGGDGLFSNVTDGNQSLEDVDIDPVVLAQLTDMSAPEDGELFRFWEVAGAVHVNQWLSFWAGAARRRDFGTDDPQWDPEMAANYGEEPEGHYDECEYNYFPHRYTFPAAIEALREWIQEGRSAPSAPRMERSEDNTLVKDEHGNAVGGIRLPPIEAPVATYEDSCQLPTGKTIRFDDASLDELYPTHEEYVSKFEGAAQQAVEDGFLLQEGADELVARAETSPIGR